MSAAMSRGWSASQSSSSKRSISPAARSYRSALRAPCRWSCANSFCCLCSRCMNPSARFVFPGFPPSPVFGLMSGRVTMYVHDTFLMTRKKDLSAKARLYMAPQFAFALRRLKRFLVNSEKTLAEVREICSPDATVTLYRPAVSNVFALHASRPCQPSVPRRNRCALQRSAPSNRARTTRLPSPSSMNCARSVMPMPSCTSSDGLAGVKMPDRSPPIPA